MKRAFDLLFSAVGLFLLFPFLVLIALLINLDSPGPVIFRQERIGKGGKIFRIHKFRTMRVAVDRDGPEITVGSDERITQLGAFLRRYKLDEFPQLIDVIKGDMSIVGPRPEVQKYVDLYPQSAKPVIFSVRPGITDAASIEFKNENQLLGSVPDPERYYVEQILPRKIQHYVAYVQHRSLWTDLVIVLRTIRATVSK